MVLSNYVSLPNMGIDKIKYFEYFLHQIVLAYGKGENDLSRLKIIKLLFFTTAARSSPEKESLLLKNVFNNFVAMPYGHVESDIYNALRGESPLQFYKIDTDSTTKIKEHASTISGILGAGLKKEYLQEIEVAVQTLCKLNESILKEPAFNLVELSHQWYSWKKNYHEATTHSRYSQPIPAEDIIQESKIFTFLPY